jgi:hypothetical protein
LVIWVFASLFVSLIGNFASANLLDTSLGSEQK